jgi:hypothetical protein
MLLIVYMLLIVDEYQKFVYETVVLSTKQSVSTDHHLHTLLKAS